MQQAIPLILVLLIFSVPMGLMTIFMIMTANRLSNAIEEVASKRDTFPNRRQGGGTHLQEPHQSFTEEA
ncbi:hypothetical protein [Nodosilinea nodulosa]|uniref:hypothetical protein n=1 Tax=Nodosilinea nodulosa TaxID=416001 RepID=UPI0003789A9D|nr:hypothetical protein [Nodosilinea nodulosa]